MFRVFFSLFFKDWCSYVYKITCTCVCRPMHSGRQTKYLPRVSHFWLKPWRYITFYKFLWLKPWCRGSHTRPVPWALLGLRMACVCSCMHVSECVYEMLCKCCCFNCCMPEELLLYLCRFQYWWWLCSSDAYVQNQLFNKWAARPDACPALLWFWQQHQVLDHTRTHFCDIFASPGRSIPGVS